MRKYETIFVIHPTLEEDARQVVIDKFKGIINSDGEVSRVDEWGMRRFAYEVNKLREGYYVLVDFIANPSLPKELERNYKISDDIVRYIVVNKDDL